MHFRKLVAPESDLVKCSAYDKKQGVNSKLIAVIPKLLSIPVHIVYIP